MPPPASRPRRAAPASARAVAVALAAAVAVLVGDVLSKAVVTDALAPGGAYVVVPGWLVLAYVRNTGAAFGVLAGQGWLVLPLSLAAAIVVPLVLWRSGVWQGYPLLGGLAAGLIIGGALGNLIERLRTGAVTDFVQVVPVPLFQVFNVADASICVGVAVLLLLGSGLLPQRP